MATIKDIAAHSRVSTATVSHVINNYSNVTPELRERVLRAVRELKYHPNAVARGLKTNQSKTVGMIVPDITNPFFPGVVRGAEDVLREAGYSLIVGNSDSDSAKEEAYYRTFSAQRVEGLLLIASLSTSPPEYLSHHDLQTTPIVFVDRGYRGVRADAVVIDNAQGSFQAVSHLLKQGHQRIGIITGPLQLVNARMRLDGYKRAFTVHHMHIENEWVREGRYDVTSGYEQTKALLGLKDRPTALFVSNAPMMLGCLRAIRERGVRCPEELALVSFDDMAWFELAHPSLSAVAQNAYELGATAAQMLAKRITGTLTGPPRRKVLKAKLLIRDSSSSNHMELKQNQS